MSVCYKYDKKTQCLEIEDIGNGATIELMPAGDSDGQLVEVYTDGTPWLASDELLHLGLVLESIAKEIRAGVLPADALENAAERNA